MSTTRDDPAPSPATSAQPTRVALAEDSLLVRKGLDRILREAGFDVVGEVASAEELLDLVERALPHVALIDIRLPPSYSDEGLRAATAIRARVPSVALLVLSQYVEAEYALRVLEGSERSIGYLLKDRILNPTQLTE